MEKTMLSIQKKRRQRRRSLMGWAFIAPAVICFVLFLLLPAVMAVGMSFTSYNVFTPAKFVGFGNYVRAFQDTYFLKALGNICLYVVMYVPAVVILSFLLAVLLNTKLRSVKIFRVLFYLPCITSTVASAIVWRWLMNPTSGLLNTILTSLGLPPGTWLNDSHTALVSIVIICVWSTLASNIMIYLAALQNVPESVYESARLDGAGPFRQMMQITLPLVAPTTFFVLTMSLIGSFQVFDQIYVLTSGGPAHATTVPMYQIYMNAFRESQMGYACAQAMLLFGMILIVTLAQQKLNKESLV
ncbi:MAG: sugar ABC transporter permease [Oscillospiraceae bacterium]|nr:sugar ABC transporter permease [Oscillospiraceae bacterium]